MCVCVCVCVCVDKREGGGELEMVSYIFFPLLTLFYFY